MTPRVLPFHKMEGVGNDFVLIEADAAQGLDYSDLAQRLCHRPFGIGADGLLVVGAGRVRLCECECSTPTARRTSAGTACAAPHATPTRQGFVDYTCVRHRDAG
jgi:hypothetical protein